LGIRTRLPSVGHSHCQSLKPESNGSLIFSPSIHFGRSFGSLHRFIGPQVSLLSGRRNPQRARTTRDMVDLLGTYFPDGRSLSRATSHNSRFSFDSGGPLPARSLNSVCNGDCLGALIRKASGREKKRSARTETMRWRQTKRRRSLELFARRATGLAWSPALFRMLIDELWAGEELPSLVGPDQRLLVSQYPYALAVVLAIRHSWRQDDLRRIAKMLRISTRDL
jgi:hypothetical protein